MTRTEMTEKPAMPEAADTNPAADSTPVATADDDIALRKRLLSRLAVAGVVILGLLGGLAVFDILNQPQAPVMPKLATAPIEPPVVSEPAKLAEAAKEEPQDDVAAEPERTENVMESPKSAKSLTLPATPRTASIKPPAPVVVPAKPEIRHEIAKPLTPVLEGAKRFLVQIGVFSNPANAEELVQKLQAAGIPARIESRVQVGPFASRAEADAARAKLKAMGIDGGLLVRR